MFLCIGQLVDAEFQASYVARLLQKQAYRITYLGYKLIDQTLVSQKSLSSFLHKD